MNGYTYRLKSNGMPYAGVIAQEALNAIPESVGSTIKYKSGDNGSDGEEGERYYTVDYSGVTGLLVQVARESDDRITALEEENAELRQNYLQLRWRLRLNNIKGPSAPFYWVG